MIEQTLIFSRFLDEFKATRPDNFSYEGLEALFDYYDTMDECIEFDPIALCCEWTEYDSIEAVQKDYKDIETLVQLEDKTLVLKTQSGGLLVREF